MTYAQRSTLKSSECDRIPIPRGLTCCGQHGAGEEQGGHEVPVALAFVPHHRHPVVTGLQRAGQQLLQARVGHAAVVAQEVAPRRLQLAAELLLVGPLDGGEDPGADQQVEDVTDNQQRKIQRGLASLHKPRAPAVAAAAADHHVPVNVGLRHLLSWKEGKNVEDKTMPGSELAVCSSSVPWLRITQSGSDCVVPLGSNKTTWNFLKSSAVVPVVGDTVVVVVMVTRVPLPVLVVVGLVAVDDVGTVVERVLVAVLIDVLVVVTQVPHQIGVFATQEAVASEPDSAHTLEQNLGRQAQAEAVRLAAFEAARTGQTVEARGCVSVALPVHPLPPFCGGGLLQRRSRVMLPAPHVVVHADQGDQRPQFPSGCAGCESSAYNL
ncbi:hypothetical protein EYF80_015921 [Liparis tanakae]|uniref:Uncharacterized protein n=1 Tax=Liparis tanakae TaxID=230148 RepID=A0A4Z2I957_9TELE|nr:hypothetical protein EYF80_015921 [Liparis tanakae]